VAGVAQALALAWPGTGQPVWWLQIASIVLLGWLLRDALSVLGGAWRGGLFAVAWLAGTFWWLHVSMHTYGGLHAAMSVGAVLALATFLASYYAIAAAVWVRWAPAHRLGAAGLFAALWLLAELARGTLWTGFPWGAGGYAHVEGPLQVLPRYIGVYGTGAVAALLGMLLASVRVRDVRNWRVWALLLVGGGLWGSAALARHCAINLCHTPTAQAPAPVSVALLQGNIPQDEKFQQGSGVPLALNWYAQAAQEATADLVIAPETAIPLLPSQLIPGYLPALVQPFEQSPRALLLGMPLGNERQGYTNSVLGFQAGGGVYQYDKHHLVPFGEFIPPMFRWFTNMMNIPLGDFNRGAVGQPSMQWAGQRIAPNICYEDLFGEELAARFRQPDAAPTIMVNFSNIAWFGNTLAIDQHLHISRMRTLELERPMVRATNTGATAIIDHRGIVTHSLPRHTRGVLLGQVEGRGLQGTSAAITPFAWWASRWGLWPLWGAGVLVLALAVLAQRRSRGY
jgi:apolipoprotein N-acyltransferase